MKETIEPETEEVLLPKLNLKTILRTGYIHQKNDLPDVYDDSEIWNENLSAYFQQHPLPLSRNSWDELLEYGRLSTHQYLTELLQGRFSIQRIGCVWKYTDDIVFSALSDKSVKQLNTLASSSTIENLITGRTPETHFIFAYALKVEGGWIKVERYTEGWKASFYSDWIYYDALLKHREYSLEPPKDKEIHSVYDVYRLYKKSLDSPRRKSPGVDTALIVLMVLFVWTGIQSAVDERYIVMSAAVLCLIGEIVLVYLAYNRKKEITEEVKLRIKGVERDASEGPDEPTRRSIPFVSKEDL